MCFKTAGLPAPSANEFKTFRTTQFGANVSYHAAARREVVIQFGGSGEPRPQIVGPADLRELAAHFNELADKLAA